MRKRRIAAIDVGTTKVCTVMADADDTGLRILGVGIVPSRGLQKGMVVNLNEARDCIKHSVAMAEQSAGYKLESACIGITGRHIHSSNNRGVIAISRRDEMVRQNDVNRALEVARNVIVPSDRQLLHLLPLTYIVDGQEGVKNPVGMHGFRLDVETHMVTASSTSIENLTKCIRSAGVEIDDLVFEPLASAEAVLNTDEKQNGVLLADIGGGTTDIAIFKDNSIIHTSVLPVAGYQITHDISVGLGVSFELAEEIKKRYANVMPVPRGEKAEEDEQMCTEGGHTFPYSQLIEIVRSRVEELIRLIVLESPGENYAELLRGGIVLTGGSCNLPGTAECAQDVTRLSCRVGVPPAMYGVSETLNDPAYATSLGLVMWKMVNPATAFQPRASSSGGMGRFFKGVFTKS